MAMLISMGLFSCAGNNGALTSEFAALYDNHFSDDEPGGVVLVKKGPDVIFVKSYGIANVTTGERITEHTIFNTGSISKTFVSNGILILEEEKLLSIEDPIYTYFPNFDHPEIAKKIHIKHLLSHTSGLPDARKVEEEKEFYLTAKDRENFEPILHVQSLNFEPGSRYEYSNPAFNGLALIIEKVSGRKWQHFIEEKIFTPAGMDHSKITDGPYPQIGVAHAYTPDDGHFREDDYGEFPTFAASGNGGIWCSVLDLAKYETAIREHLFLSGEAVEKSRKIYSPECWNDTIPAQIGCSWFIMGKHDEANTYGVKIVYHTGSQGGFRAFFVSIPEKNLFYAGLFNRPVDGLDELRNRGLELLKEHNWLD
ncbi:beta-lactamase family protein [bacterium]|nr:beta-lactamase family protein [bacterium]